MRFFSGLRDSEHLVLAGIWAPSMLDFESGKTTPFGNGQLQVDSESPPDDSTDLLNRSLMAQAACYNPDPTLTTDLKGYVGQAQIRLESFKNKFDPSVWSEQSICDPTNYSAVLLNVANRINTRLGVNCLSVPPKLDTAGNPECLVGYVDANQSDALPDVYMPTCSSTCCAAWSNSPQPIGFYGAGDMLSKDPDIISACTSEPADCYCAVSSTQNVCTGTAIGGVWQKGNAAPPDGKVVSFRCAGSSGAGANPGC